VQEVKERGGEKLMLEMKLIIYIPETPPTWRAGNMISKISGGSSALFEGGSFSLSDC